VSKQNIPKEEFKGRRKVLKCLSYAAGLAMIQTIAPALEMVFPGIKEARAGTCCYNNCYSNCYGARGRR